MRVWIGDAGVDQRRHAKGEQPRRLGDGLRFEPARHGEDAGRRQRIQENAPAFTRIQPVLGQRERPGAGRRPGIDERHLQDVELLTGAGQVRAGFVVHEPDARGIDDPGECPVALGDGTEQDPVDLDAGHRRIAKRQAGQDVAAAADADDADPAIPQLVRQRGDVVLRPPELVCRALPLRNRGAGHTVDRRPRHSGRELRRLVGAAPEKHMTLGRHLNDHIRVRVPPGEIDDGSQEPQVTALRVDRAKRMADVAFNTAIATSTTAAAAAGNIRPLAQRAKHSAPTAAHAAATNAVDVMSVCSRIQTTSRHPPAAPSKSAP